MNKYSKVKLKKEKLADYDALKKDDEKMDAILEVTEKVLQEQEQKKKK